MEKITKGLKLAVNKVFPFMESPVAISRQGNFPLDKSSIWWDLGAAQEYARSNPIAYPGQPITVVDEGSSTVSFYLIGTDGELVKQGNDAAIEDLKRQLQAHKVEYDALKQAQEKLKKSHEDLSAKVEQYKGEFDRHTHTSDQITETGTKVFVSPEQKAKIDTIVYAGNSDIDSLFPELHKDK